MNKSSQISFYQRVEKDILSGKKTITIRNQVEKGFVKDSLVQASTYEDNKWFATLLVEGIEAVTFKDINEFHAKQENMSLTELKQVIKKIYPNDNKLFVISFTLLNEKINNYYIAGKK